MQRTLKLAIVFAIGGVACAAAARNATTTLGAVSQQGDDFRWSGQIARGKRIEIKGVNGDVRAELASGNQVEVVARKHARRSNPGR